MKQTIIFINLLIFGFLSAQAQSGYDEYTYWGAKVGVTHSFLDAQPGSDFNNLMLQTPIGSIQMKPVDQFKSYTPGFKGAIVLNKDMKNDKMGIVLDLGVSNYGVSGHYITPENPDYWADINYNVMAAQGAILLKIGGKELYDLQRYMYVGGKFNYNFMLYQNQKVSWTADVLYVKQPKEMLKNYNIAATAGLNYMFFFAEVDYVPGGFFQKGYQMSLPNGAAVEPVGEQANSVVYFTTGINLPLNSWTSRKLYDIETTIKRWFK